MLAEVAVLFKVVTLLENLARIKLPRIKEKNNSVLFIVNVDIGNFPHRAVY